MKIALFACSLCAASSVIPADSDLLSAEHVTLEDGAYQAISRCALVRETDTDDHDVCNGDVMFVGFFEAAT